MTIEELYHAIWQGGLDVEQGDMLDELVTKCHRLERERDALFADLKSLEHCEVCKHNKTEIFNEPCKNCGGAMWEWRGVNHDR